MDQNLHLRLEKPPPALAPFVAQFWALENTSAGPKDLVVMPDGRTDLILSQAAGQPFQITRSGLESYPESMVLAPDARLFGISFNLPAVESVFHSPIAGLLNSAAHLPNNFWGFWGSRSCRRL